MARLELALLGPFRITLDDQPVAGVLASPTIQALLAFLAVEAERPHTREMLAELLWPGRPEGMGRQNLRQILSRMRRALQPPDGEPPFLRANRNSLQFNPESDSRLDVTVFTEAVVFAQTHSHASIAHCHACCDRLNRAAALYRGDLLQDLVVDSQPYEEWALLKREWLRREALSALDHLTEYHLWMEDSEAAYRCAWRQVELDPLREAAHRQVMRALAASDRRTAALEQFEQLRRILDQELGVVPAAETSALYEQIRDQRLDSGPKPTDRPRHNLPRQFSPFLGREFELNGIKTRLKDPTCGLLTLTGMGGVGKSRLAIQAAQEHIRLHRGAAVFVPLAAVSSPEGLVPAIAAAVGQELAGTENPRNKLLNALASQDLLLVLDNFEHLTKGADLVLDILQNAPGVRILVTSREPLNLRAEWLFHVDGLPYPKASEPLTVEDLPDRYPALALFMQTAQRVHHRFAPGLGEMRAVAHICRLVRGLPLGIELAASLVHGSSPTTIAEALENNLDLLNTHMRDVPARQRSIRAVFDYSWELLNKSEQATLAALAAFRGGFTTAAAREVAPTSGAVLESLHTKSFIRPNGPDRYELHELIGQYAAEKLATQAAAQAAARRRHSRYYARFFKGKEATLQGAEQPAALRGIRTEIENLRQGWSSALQEGDAGLVSDYAEGFWGYYDDLGLYHEGLDAFRAALRIVQDRDIDKAVSHYPIRVQALLSMGLGFFYFRLGHYEQAGDHLEAALSRFRALDAGPESAHCQFYLGAIASDRGNMAESLHRLQQALAAYQSINSQRGVANVLAKMGSVLELVGRYEDAQEALARSLAIKRELGAPSPVAVSLNNLALLLWRVGDYEQAEVRFRESLAIDRELGNQGSEAIALSNLGRLYLSMGRYPDAQAHLNEALSLEQAVGNKRHEAIVLNNLGVVAHRLGDDAIAFRRLADGLALNEEIGNTREIAFSLLYLGQVYLAARELSSAKGHYYGALKLAIRLGLTPLVLELLVEIARVLIVEEEPERALALLTLPLRHPGTWHSTREAASGIKTELLAMLPPELVKAANEGIGRTELERVRVELMDELARDGWARSAPTRDGEPMD